MSQENCYLVKGASCDYHGSCVKIIAIDDIWAWVWSTSDGSSPGLIVPLEDLKLIQSTAQKLFESGPTILYSDAGNGFPNSYDGEWD